MRAPRLRVSVDLLRLRANLAHSDGRPASEHNARDYLVDAGFTVVRDGAICLGDKHALAHLRADEVRRVDPVAT